MDYDVIIVGAGPAGLFAAEKISYRRPSTKMLVIDKGKEISQRKCPARKTDKSCLECKLCNISCGIGGAGGLSDGKLNLDHRVGMDISELQIDKKKADEEIAYIDDIFMKYGADSKVYGEDNEKTKELIKRTEEKSGKSAELWAVKQRHMGSDKTPDIISRFQKDLMSRGVEFMVKTEVTGIKANKGGFKVKTSKGVFSSKYLFVAPGRSGAYWFRNQAEKLGIEYTFGEIDVGVRVEVKAEDYKEFTDVFYDPKFHIKSQTYRDDVRTFCTNPRGEVTAELIDSSEFMNHLTHIRKYITENLKTPAKRREASEVLDSLDSIMKKMNKKNLILVNGHASKNKKTENTNFAILYTIKLDDPQEDTTSYGQRIAEFVNFISGQKPMVQRYGDLIGGRRSKEDSKSWKTNEVKPTLKGCNPGDLGMALTYRSMLNVIETLKGLEQICPGVIKESTLIFGPEIKFYDIRYATTKNLETKKRKNLYIGGDGAGKSRGIVGAALGGLLVAEGVLAKLK